MTPTVCSHTLSGNCTALICAVVPFDHIDAPAPSPISTSVNLHSKPLPSGASGLVKISVCTKRMRV